ncbi:MAG: type II toxin-antitoxin system mRNA interferase toxin, RelE/StbE family [Patescibacteria group bacterium]|nr:type II toxin-antitoxin system mRNA interferase toxin, RelE/StbE family [Patescibacteria group bacterium]
MAKKILFSRKFLKHFEKRIILDQRLSKKFNLRIKQFSINEKSHFLKDHQLKGSKKHLRSFSITGDIRILYQNLGKNNYLLVDIGTHNQVY